MRSRTAAPSAVKELFKSVTKLKRFSVKARQETSNAEHRWKTKEREGEGGMPTGPATGPNRDQRPAPGHSGAVRTAAGGLTRPWLANLRPWDRLFRSKPR